MRAAIRKGNGYAVVRIPAALLEEVSLKVNESVEIRGESGRMVIEPLRRREYRLAELVKGITAKNQHEEIEFGGPVGKEVE